MGGEHGGEPGALAGGAELGEGDGAVHGIGPGQVPGEGGQRQVVRFGGAAGVAAQPLRAFSKGTVPQHADQAGDAVQVQLATVQLAGDRQRHQQHRVAERVLGCAGTGRGDLVGQRLGQALDGRVLLVHAASWCDAQ